MLCVLAAGCHGRRPAARDAGRPLVVAIGAGEAPPSPTVALDAGSTAPVDAPVDAPAATASPAPGVTQGCPEGMLAVQGSFCPEVEQNCTEIMRDGYERCAHFERPTVCRSAHRQPLNFCIDRYEWPNRRGERPVVLVDWNQATAHCASLGRRLCTEHEWTFACEGEDMLPYPYGYDRDSAACNIDNLARRYDRAALRRGGESARAEVERVWMGAPSGARDRCVSPFGVYDLTGNVDEWTVSATGRPFRSTLKGGWWGRVRTRCRPVTRSHYEHFEYYQIGFRCCADRTM